MSNFFEIASHKGVYEVHYLKNIKDIPFNSSGCFYLIDSKVCNLYSAEFPFSVDAKNVIKIDALESNKSLESAVKIIHKLIDAGIKRQNLIVAIGGGIVQDLACFISTVLYRGVEWSLIPTTLLSQADSCIGSKSSINLDGIKNILGTFNPPRRVYVCPKFLKTLEQKDVFSGVGEIIKVHAIASKESFDAMANDYVQLISDPDVLKRYIDAALRIKKGYIEADEFDAGLRNIFNYGHSFGHAIEVATNYRIPHGIAITIGMDMANYIAMRLDLIVPQDYERMHILLRKNYALYSGELIPHDLLLDALSKDKKNTNTKLVLILPKGPNCTITKVELLNNLNFSELCKSYLEIFFEK